MTPAPTNTREFTDWPSLRDFIDTEFGEGFRNTDFVFRGEPQCYPTVLPVIDRLLPPDQCAGGMPGRLVRELESMLRFRGNAPMRLDPLQERMIDATLQTQVLMRHYGAPTRLLDWTQSPWIALYCACEDVLRLSTHPPVMGRVLAIDRAELGAAARAMHGAEIDEYEEMVMADRGFAVPHFILIDYAARCGAWVHCYHRHAAAFPRLVAQQGLFTLASKPWVDHWTTAQLQCPNHWKELRIAAPLKLQVMRRLRRMGITAASLFPDIEGVAREIGEFAKMFQQP